MTSRWLIAVAVSGLLPSAALAASDGLASPTPKTAAVKVDLARQLNEDERAHFRQIFTALNAKNWVVAQSLLDSAKPSALRDLALAELYTAKGSPKVELDPLVQLLERAPDLPQAPKLTELAQRRGATAIPAPPQAQRMVWLGGKPGRVRAASTKGDAAAAALGAKIMPHIKIDDPVTAERILNEGAAGLSAEGLTEWQQKVAWSYYMANNDAGCRALAAKAQSGVGEWAVQADWVQGLAAWRQKDYSAAQKAFESVAQRGEDEDMRSAGLYWASRADIALGQPQKVQPRLRLAAKMDDSFYGLLAAEQLGIKQPLPNAPRARDLKDYAATRPNVRAALALGELGEYRRADDLLRYQARISPGDDHPMLVALAARLNLPETQIWLAHNGPAGTRVSVADHYPAPDWTPDGGWRVDKALIFAHALQESNFRRDAVSRAGAYGLMQLMPAAAKHMAKDFGGDTSRDALTRPTTNMEFGQRYIEYLRDLSGTQGLLPKVIAAYNAGPAPVERWNSLGIDRGDPLLYIESIPYWETRGYVTIVLRNYWMYARNAGQPTPSLSAIAQGQWPKFPGLSAQRMAQGGGSTRSASAD